jgi:hypothetical protein
MEQYISQPYIYDHIGEIDYTNENHDLDEFMPWMKQAS